jgi:hypothetical protein
MITNKTAATMNKIESTTDMSQQRTKSNQQQTCRSYCSNQQTRRNKQAADQNDVSSQFHYAEPLSTFREQTIAQWMAHWCGIAHDHAEIDATT